LPIHTAGTLQISLPTGLSRQAQCETNFNFPAPPFNHTSGICKNLADTWPAVTRVLSRGRERTLGTRLTCYVHENIDLLYVFELWVTNMLREVPMRMFSSLSERAKIERGKVKSRCFYWCPAAMLESLRRAPTWRLRTKHYNFQWYLLPNNSSSEYRNYPKPWHVVYLLLLYDISVFWLNLLNGKRFKSGNPKISRIGRQKRKNIFFFFHQKNSFG